MAKYILLLGGFGRVGIETARYLLKHTDFHITLASRNSHPVPDDLTHYEKRISTLTLNATDNTEALKQACKNADLLISCIGPSGIVGDKIAKICKQTATPLVDAGGYDRVIHSLDKDERISPSPVPLIINVGLLPGISGMFPCHVIEQTAAGRDIRQLDVQYVGRDAWSYNSAWDIIDGLGDFGVGRGFCYFDQGNLIQVPMHRAGNKAQFSAPIGKVSTMLIYAEEIVRLARQYNIQTAKVFGANIGPRATLVCGLAKIFRQYTSHAKIKRAAKYLVKASEKDMNKLEPAYGVSVEVQYSSGAPASGQLILSDTYQATGTTIGITAKLVLEGKSTEPGVYMLHEAIDDQLFMQFFEQAGMIKLKDICVMNDILTVGAS